MDSDQTTDTTQKSTTHIFQIIHTTDTIHKEIMNLHGFKKNKRIN